MIFILILIFIALVLLIAEIFFIAMYCLRKLEDRLNGIWLAIKCRLERIEEKTNKTFDINRNEINNFLDKIDSFNESAADGMEKNRHNKNIDLSKEVADMLEYAANVVKGSEDK